MGDLEIVMVIVTAVKGFVQGIVSNTVEGASVYPAAVVSVDDLTHEPEVWLYFFGCTAELLHEIEVQNVCCIQTDTVYVKFGNPEADHNADIVLYLRISLV